MYILLQHLGDLCDNLSRHSAQRPAIDAFRAAVRALAELLAEELSSRRQE